MTLGIMPVTGRAAAVRVLRRVLHVREHAGRRAAAERPHAPLRLTHRREIVGCGQGGVTLDGPLGPTGSRSAAMPVESLFPRLEPLLAKVSKPIQYVGGELNSTVKDWDACDVRWALMYPDAYEVGVPNQGVMILYEVLNEADGVLAERTYAVWPDMEALMREHGVPAFTVDAHRPVGAFDVLGVSLRHRARLHQPAADPRPRGHPAARRRPHRGPPGGRRRRARGLQPRAGGRLRRRRGARRRRAGRAADQRRWCARWKAAGPPRRTRRSCCCGWPAPAGSTCPRSTTSSYLARRPDQAGRAEHAPACPGGSASTPSWTSTSGPTRSSRWCRWPSRCTSGRRSRSSAAAPAAAGSARPA